ncbi:MAG: hypothetical protein A2729_00050 [Candidatus Buchananbacteria bacterium RIFCSPHIGHO2_01_FULL_39_14]|uniref:Uncharacterized protein n=1 Tax=Candidatus Buchananbacteria bacterium RIFCSPHIGHO2_01_FULL_39_14 TaxID=1797532 RepID=A0A1G1XWW2_9BACT|nr:MAG: hypothetical protein A2729_00050 [Candidatus Buchananbacteria bacterium RIFCSPHIGHO2_01_FULL_39_14]
MAEYYVCVARKLEIDNGVFSSLGSEQVFICDKDGKTSNDYSTSFISADEPNNDYQLEKLQFGEQAKLEELLNRYAPRKEGYVEGSEWTFHRGDYVNFADLYGRRQRWGEMLTPQILTSVQQISQSDVDTICDILCTENLKFNSARDKIKGKYQTELEEEELRYHAQTGFINNAFQIDLAKIQQPPSLLEVAASLER